MKLDKRKFEMIRAEKCMTKKEVAKRAMVSSQTMYNALNGKNTDGSYLGKLAKALDVPVQDIIISEETT